ncbi:serine protease family s1c htra-related [Holotrichia oblita]|nr:serine protease family s1c htra-related [Holotrichia oblita]
MNEFNNQFEGGINLNSETENRETQQSSFVSSYHTEINAIARPRVYTERRNAKKTNKKWIALIVAVVLVLNAGIMASGIYLGKSLSDNAAKQRAALSIKPSDDVSQINPEGYEAVQTVQEGMVLTVPQIAKKAGPSVVGISSTIEQISFFGTSSQDSSGSGIILNTDGYIVTNNHVVEKSTSVRVTLNTGAEYPAKIIGRDSRSDLAVLKIEAKEELHPAEIGDSSKIEVGEVAVAIGNPLGQEFAGSVTVGVISAVNRSMTIQNKTLNLIQTDAAINFGNSGGALVNGYGQVIGINTAKLSTTGVEGMGFAIPMSEATPVISDLIANGYVKGRPVIGISGRVINEQTAKAQGWVTGIQITEVVENSGADIAGLKRGDIIMKFNDEKVMNIDELNKFKDKYKSGDIIKLEVYRYETEKTETINVKLGEEKPQ